MEDLRMEKIVKKQERKLAVTPTCSAKLVEQRGKPRRSRHSFNDGGWRRWIIKKLLIVGLCFGQGFVYSAAENSAFEASDLLMLAQVSEMSALIPLHQEGRLVFSDQSIPMQAAGTIIGTSANGKKPYACNEYDMTFIFPPLFERLKRKHTGEKSFACSVCDKSFTLLGNLQEHIRTHTRNKLHSCVFADFRKSFARSGDWKGHQQKHEKDISVDSQDTMPTLMSALLPLRQEEKMALAVVADQEVSIQVAGAHTEQRSDKEKKKFKCSHKGCGKIFAQIEGVEGHQWVHAKGL